MPRHDLTAAAGRSRSPRASGRRRAVKRTARGAERGPSATPLAIVILAAGEGKRMHSALPKVLQPLAGRPLLQHVIDTARTLAPSAIHVVYGHGGERVRSALRDAPVSWTLQDKQLGTGHAVLQAMPQIPDDHRVLVLYGDVPLIRRETLAELAQLAGADGLGLLTARLDEPQGYGRIVRNARGLVQRIVEQKDATTRQLAIRECNTGVLVSPARRLRSWLDRLTAANAQGEYYLTDVIAMAVKERVSVRALLAEDASEVLGVNDKVQLAQLESV